MCVCVCPSVPAVASPGFVVFGQTILTHEPTYSFPRYTPLTVSGHSLTQMLCARVHVQYIYSMLYDVCA